MTNSDDQIKPSATKESPVAPAIDQSLQFFKGVGPVRVKLLAKMGIHSAADLLDSVPRAWEDRRLRFTVKNAPMGEKITLRGVIRHVEFSQTRNGLGIATASIQDGNDTLAAVWFKKCTPRYDVFASLRQQLQPNIAVYLFGAIEWGVGGRQLRVEDLALLDSSGKLQPADQAHFERIVPLYTVPDGLPEKLLRSLIFQVLLGRPTTSHDIVPPAYRPKFGFTTRATALERFHFPATLVEKEEARNHLAFEEFLILETALMMVRKNLKQKRKRHNYSLKKSLLTPFRMQMGFEFTPAQRRVIREIFDDLMSTRPMYRLLQGDVGSGKTVVALCAMLLAAENGGQSALMAPTEILAEQHALTFGKYLDKLGVTWTLLTGRQKAAQKKIALENIHSGTVSLVVGTHALLQRHVRFKRLMLAVIDEQHRFGVEHRTVLRDKGEQPDVLVMTATPIPRSLAMTVYGDLDVSVIDELPPGRTPVVTRRASEVEAYQHVLKTVAAGQQAYMVYPLVRESDKIELKAVVQETARLKTTVFKTIRVGILHGQLLAQEKDAVMKAFRSGSVDLLIATSIIEVGIDVPNASLMVIQHAERFGLSTLHQLRGRVGRGAAASNCLLVSSTKSDDATRRLNAMVRTTNGFTLSEEDLSMRGPGDVMGTQQHGIPFFKIGDLVQDARWIHHAREVAQDILARDPHLRDSAHQPLKNAVYREFASTFHLVSAG